jgi:hypothetical protein
MAKISKIAKKNMTNVIKIFEKSYMKWSFISNK